MEVRRLHDVTLETDGHSVYSAGQGAGSGQAKSTGRGLDRAPPQECPGHRQSLGGGSYCGSHLWQ